MSGRACVITGTGGSMGRETGVDVVVDGGDARLVIRRLETVPQVVEIVLTDRLLKE
jgi:hypothetical protein